MGEAKRRQEWRDSIRQLHKEAGGAVLATTWHPAAILQIVTGGAPRNETNRRAIKIIAELFAGIRERKDDPKGALMCLTCNRMLHQFLDHSIPGTFAVSLIHGYRDDPHQAMTVCVCSHCAPTFEDIDGQLLVGLRKVWPDLRAININPDAGHA